MPVVARPRPIDHKTEVAPGRACPVSALPSQARASGRVRTKSRRAARAAASSLQCFYNYMCYYRVSSEICPCSTTRSCHVRETHFLVKPPGLPRGVDGADEKGSVTCLQQVEFAGACMRWGYEKASWAASIAAAGYGKARYSDSQSTWPVQGRLRRVYEMPFARCCILSRQAVSSAHTKMRTGPT